MLHRGTMRFRPSAFLLHHGSIDGGYCYTSTLNSAHYAVQNIGIEDVTRRVNSSMVKMKTGSKNPALIKQAQRLRNRKKKSSVQKQQNAQVPLTNSAGRPIMTEGRLQSYPTHSSYDMTTNNPKSLLNNVTKRKLHFVQHLAFNTWVLPETSSFSLQLQHPLNMKVTPKNSYAVDLAERKRLPSFTQPWI